MAYWVDREHNPETAGFSTLAIGDDRATLQPEALAFVDALTAAQRGDPMGGPATLSVEAKGLGSPLTAMFTRAFLADGNDFPFNATKRQRMVQTVKERVSTDGGPFVVVGHSQGSMVTYQALMDLGAALEVDLFVTIGSPLGLPQVTDVLQKWHGKKLPIPAGVKRWVNIAEDGDIVCLDQCLADE